MRDQHAGRGARTSTFALNNVTLPFVLALADKGLCRALGQDPHLRSGLNVHEGKITHRAVADALKLPFTPPEAVLAALEFSPTNVSIQRKLKYDGERGVRL